MRIEGAQREAWRRQAKPAREPLTGDFHRLRDGVRRGMRLEFTNGLRAEVPREEFAAWGSTREWLIEFPPGELRAL